MDREYTVDVTDKADVTRVITELNNLVKKPKLFLKEAYCHNYYEYEISIKDANGNDCYDAFAKALTTFKLKAKMKAFVNNVLKLKEIVLESEERAFGLPIFREYACLTEEGVEDYDSYVSWIDLDHDVYVFEYFFDILEAHGWTPATTELYATFLGEGDQHAHESFPISGLQEYFTTEKKFTVFFDCLNKADRHNFHGEEFDQWKRDLGGALGFVDPRCGEDRPEFADYETEESFPLVQALHLPDDEFIALLDAQKERIGEHYIHEKTAKRTVLMAALEMEQPSIEKIKALIERGADSNEPEQRLWNGEWNRGNTPFLEAIRRTRFIRSGSKEIRRPNEQISTYREIVEYMINHGAELAPVHEYNPLVTALKAGDEETLKLLGEKFEYDVSAPDSHGVPLIFSAAEHTASLKFMIEHGADANSVHPNGDSLLFAVIRYIDYDPLLYIISQGADRAYTDPSGRDTLAVLDESMKQGVERDVRRNTLDLAYKYDIKPLLRSKLIKKVNLQEFKIESTEALPLAFDELIEKVKDRAEFLKTAKFASNKYSFKPLFTVDGCEILRPCELLVEMGHKVKLGELFTAISALGVPVYDSKASVWGTAMIPLVCMDNTEYHGALAEYVMRSNPQGARKNFYNNLEVIIDVMKKFPTEQLLSLPVNEYDCSIYTGDLVPVLGESGPAYDLFWKLYEAEHGAEETEDQSSYYDTCYRLAQYDM